MGLFTEPQAQFFAAELILALEHLHSHNIVCSAAHQFILLRFEQLTALHFFGILFLLRSHTAVTSFGKEVIGCTS